MRMGSISPSLVPSAEDSSAGQISVFQDKNCLIFGSAADTTIITCDEEGNDMCLWDSLEHFGHYKEQALHNVPDDEEMRDASNSHDSGKSVDEGSVDSWNNNLWAIPDTTRRNNNTNRMTFDFSLDDAMISNLFEPMTPIDSFVDVEMDTTVQRRLDVSSEPINLINNHPPAHHPTVEPIKGSSYQNRRTLMPTVVKNRTREQQRRKCIKGLVDDFISYLPPPDAAHYDRPTKAQVLNACSNLLNDRVSVQLAALDSTTELLHEQNRLACLHECITILSEKNHSNCY